MQSNLFLLVTLFYDHHLTTHQSNIVVQLRKVTEYQSHTLGGQKAFLLVNILHLEVKNMIHTPPWNMIMRRVPQKRRLRELLPLAENILHPHSSHNSKYCWRSQESVQTTEFIYFAQTLCTAIQTICHIQMTLGVDG